MKEEIKGGGKGRERGKLEDQKRKKEEEERREEKTKKRRKKEKKESPESNANLRP